MITPLQRKGIMPCKIVITRLRIPGHFFIARIGRVIAPSAGIDGQHLIYLASFRVHGHNFQ